MCGWKPPSPLPNNTLTVLLTLFATARSSLLSPLKSPVTTESGPGPTLKSDLLSTIDEVGSVIGKNTVLEAPPRGLGLTTVTEAVLAVAMSEARILANNCELLTKLVARALPFQFTTDPETKPVPFTVSVNPALPGAIASGTSG